MKRILFFNDSLTTGGTEILLVGLLNHLAEKCKITLLLPQPSAENTLLKELSPKITLKYIYNGKTSRLNKKISESLLVFCPRLFARLKKLNVKKYDEVVCFKETLFAPLFSRMAIPKILWIHNIMYKRQYEIRSLKERMAVWLNKKQLKRVQHSYSRFDKVICVSDATKQAFIDVLHNGHTPQQDIRTLYNAIDLTSVREKSKEAIADIPQGYTSFILITRPSAEKRTDRLINAAYRLKEEGYTFRIYIIGDNSDSLKNDIHTKGLSEVITLMGRLKNPFPYILQCNWSLCVSERESFSLALLESMALKTPVITTDCGGPRDITEGGKYGILVENNSEGVYQGIKMTLDHPSLSLQYSTNLDEAILRFDYSNWLKQISDLLKIAY